MTALFLLFAATLSAASIEPFVRTVPVLFEENRGQSPAHFRHLLPYYHRGFACDAIYGRDFLPAPFNRPITMRLVGANTACTARLVEPAGSYSHYYRGERKAASLENVAHYSALQYSGVWPGVDVEYRGGNSYITATFSLSSPAALRAVQLVAEQNGYFTVDNGGDSGFFSGWGRWTVRATQGSALPVRARLGVSGLTFEVPQALNAPLALIFELPITLVAVPAAGAVVDKDLNLYRASAIYAYADDDSRSATCFRGSITAACPDISVLKFDSRGRLLYHVFLLGSRYDAVSRVAVDPDGNVFVAGTTYSQDFVTTEGALQTTYSGPAAMAVEIGRVYPGGDAFVAKIHGETGGLIYSTLFGTDQVDFAAGFGVDDMGRTYLLVGTRSSGLPLKGDPLVNTPACTEQTFPVRVTTCYFLVSLEENGAALRYSLASPATAMQVSRTGSVFLPGRGTVTSLGPDGGLRYRVAVPEDVSQPLLAPDESVWLYRSVRDARQVLLAGSLYRIGPTGGDPVRIAERIPPGSAAAFNASGELWMTVPSSIGDPLLSPPTLRFTAPPEAPLPEACPGCGGLYRIGPAGVIRFATFTPSETYSVLVAGPRVLFSTSETSYILDETAPVGPVLSGIFDTASPTVNFLAGNVITLYGGRIGPTTEVSLPLNGGRIATEVEGKRVLIGGLPAPILHAASGRITCMVPFRVPEYRDGELQLESSGVVVARRAIRFSGGPAYHVLWGPNAPPGYAIWNGDGSPNSEAQPAPTGSVIRFSVVAVGPTDPPLEDGVLVQTAVARPTQPVNVSFGMSEPYAEVIRFSQASGKPAGIFEMEVRLPQSLPGGDAVVRLPILFFGPQPSSIPYSHWNLPTVYVRR